MDSCACGKSAIVPAYRLVQPSYILFKISSFLSVLQFEVNVKTGDLHFKPSSRLSRFLYCVNYSVVFTKVIQLSYSIFQFWIETNLDAVTPFVTVLLLLCLVIVGLVWNVEIQKHKNEFTILHKSLQLQHSLSTVKMLGPVKIRERSQLLALLKIQVHMVKSKLQSYCRALVNDLHQLNAHFSVRDVLALIPPFAIPVIMLLGLVCVIVNEPVEALVLSIFPTLPKPQFLIISIGSKIFDCIVVAFVGLTLHGGFYISTLIQSVYHRRLNHLFEEAR